LLIAGLFFTAPLGDIAGGATYYLDAVNGDDSNPGTSALPWKTVDKGWASLAPGDTVLLRTGSYGEIYKTNYLNAGDWITWKADTGHTPEFTRIHVNNSSAKEVHLILDGLTIRRPLDTSTLRGIYFTYANYINCLNCTLIGNGISPGSSASNEEAIRYDNSTDVNVSNCTIRGWGTGRHDGWGCGVHGSGTTSNIKITDCNIMQSLRGIVQGGTNTLIARNYIHNISSDGIIFSGQDVTIEDNVVRDLELYTPVLSETPTETTWSSDGYVMTNPNAKWNTPGVGYVPSAGMKLRIYSGSHCVTGDSCATWIDGSQHDLMIASVDSDTQITLLYSIKDANESPAPHDVNYIIESYFHGDGMQMSAYQPDCQNIIIRRNKMYGVHNQIWWLNNPSTSNPATRTYGTHNMLIENNLLYWHEGEPNVDKLSGGPQVQMSFIDGITFRNNTVSGYVKFADCKNVSIYNNVISYLTVESSPSVIITSADYNIINRGIFPTQGSHTVCFHPGGINSAYATDPAFWGIFADASAGDFRPASGGSLPVGFADPSNSPTDDIAGNLRDTLPDAGCYEYHGPVLDNIGDKTIFVNNLLTFTINATDPDGDPITFSVQNLPSGAAFQGQTFSWTPTGGQVGTYQVTFIAGDGSEQDSETITITVKSTNQAPTANAGPDQTAIDSDGNGSQQVTLNGSGSTDSDGTIQSYVWSEGGTQLATGVNPTVTLAVGQHTITLTVTDNGGLTDTDAVVITVNKSGTNQPPIANAGSDQTVTDADGNGSEQVTLNGSGSSDPGGAIQTYVWREGGSQISTGANPTVTLSVGQHTITLTVTDNGGLTDTDTVMITINPINDNSPPSVTNCSPAADSIQVPLNNLITLHIVDAGKGVDANSVTIKVNSNTVYSGNTANYTSATGNCRRTGTKSDYTFVYQPNEMFDFEQKLTVAVNAADLGGKVMPECTYSFWTEMRSFGKNKRVSLGLDNLGSAAPSTVRDSNGNIYAVWHAGPAGSRDIYVNKLVDEAANFTGSIQLIADPADQCNPAIALGSSDNLYVVWQDNRRGNWDVYLCSSADGVNWSAASRISDSNDSETNPAIAVGSTGGAGIVWQQDNQTGNPDIHIATSSDGFATKAVSQITANASDQTDPAIAVDSANTVYVVWTDKRNGSNDIYGAASNSGPWTNVPIANNTGNQSSPAIAAETAGSILHLLWVDDASGNSDIYHAATNGLPSSPLTGSSIIDDSSGRNQVEPAIAVTGSTGNNLEIFACWQDRRNVAGAIGDTDLYFAEVNSDGGTNVFVGDDSTNSNQNQPAIGVDAQGHPYLVWSDSRSANPQIYYAGSTYLDSEAVDSELVAASAGAIVGTRPENIDSVDDVSVIIPPGACSCDLQITISEIKNPQEFAAQCLAVYDFGPSGVQFNQPVKIMIPYSFSGSSPKPYWFNSLTGALSQQGMTNIQDMEISPTLHVLSFETTHFTPFYVVEGTTGGTGGGGGGGGGCSVSATGNGSIVEFLLPYMALAAAMMILRLRDAHQRKERRLTKSES
jgi:hypothetical protein